MLTCRHVLLMTTRLHDADVFATCWGIRTAGCYGDVWFNSEFQVSDISAPSTGTVCIFLFTRCVKPETEHVFHTLLGPRQERPHCARVLH